MRPLVFKQQQKILTQDPVYSKLLQESISHIIKL